MKPDNDLEALLLEIYTLMPSSGSYPFTIVLLDGGDSDCMALPPVNDFSTWLLFLKRTDFKEADLLDYVINTEEYQRMFPDYKKAYLNSFRNNSSNHVHLADWCERIIAMAIGMMASMTGARGICLQPVEMDLTLLDRHFGFHTRDLQAWKLFDASYSG